MHQTTCILRSGLLLAVFFTVVLSTNSQIDDKGIERTTCTPFKGTLIHPVSETRKRVHILREQMLIRATLKGPEIDAYILPSYDEHLNEEPAAHDRRLQYLTGFTGPIGLVAITLKNAAFWTDQRYLEQANGELDCDWEIFPTHSHINLTKWLSMQLPLDTRVGADPHVVPHYLWRKWELELADKFIGLVKINNNLVDFVWKYDRPQPPQITIKVQEVRFAGEKWQSKIATLRETLQGLFCDAMIVTSLTEIAYILNIRGRDLPYIPVVKGYLLVTHNEVMLYTDRNKVPLGVFLHLKGDLCHNNMCVKIKDYNDIWTDLRTYQQIWKKVLVPAPCVFDKGVSEAVHSAIPVHMILEKISPIIFMKAQKNDAEQAGMRMAHIRDGAAMCEAMYNLAVKFSYEKWTELKVKYEVERSRMSQPHSKGLALPTVVAFGKHSALPYYTPSNVTDIEVTDESTMVIESGGQYLEGTTDVSRTFHFGTPTDEQRKAYTTVLAGIIRLSKLKFPANLHPAEIDALSRSPVWGSMSDYPHGTGHGIGSYLSVKESPIDVSYTNEQKFKFQEGYFLSNEPGYYKNESFGIRLGNVLQVFDTGYQHPSGEKFLAFKDVTLVPYERKLIDRTLLSAQEKRWLNEYNAKIRQLVGDELLKRGNMQAFYWMMNNTKHVREYLPEYEYRNSGCADPQQLTIGLVLLGTIFFGLSRFYL